MTVRMTLLRVEGNVKLQKQRVSRWRREKVQMNHELYLVKVVNSNKSVSRWQNISPSTAQTVISKCRHQYAAQQAVSSVVWSCSCRELLDVACIRANDSCWTLILYSKPKAQGISQPKIWWRKKERGGNQCVQWRCKAHVRCPCFPGNFLKPYSQPVTEKWMGKAGHGLSFPAWKKNNVILSRRFTGCDTTDAGRSPSRCRGGQSYVFSCASVRGGACLWSHPKLSSSYISHRATCRHEKNTAFSHERAMKSSSFSYVWVSNAGTRRKVRAQVGSLRRRVREWVWLRRSGG